MDSKRRKAIKWSKRMVLLPACTWASITILPFFFMALFSFKQSSETFMSGVFSLPEHFSLANYVEVLERRFGIYFKNSRLTLLLPLVGILVISSLASYVFTRLEGKWANRLLAVVVVCMSIPIHIALIPVFTLAQKFHIYDIVFGPVGLCTVFYLPTSIFVLSGFTKGIPKELEEAAPIDGCSYYQIFAQTILSLSKLGTAITAAYDSVYIWNEFSFALILTSSMKSKIPPLAILDFKGEYTMNAPLTMTVPALRAIPMIIALYTGQDKLVKGMMAGAVKG